MGRQQNTFIFDRLLQLKDAGLVAADGAAQVGGVAKVLDLGPGRVDGIIVIDVTAIEVATGNETYHIIVQGSNTADLSAGKVFLGSLLLGANAAILDDADSVVGRHELHFSNERVGTLYQFIRLYTDVSGTIATGINFSAFLAQQKGGR
jgi:hypothetical protein